MTQKWLISFRQKVLSPFRPLKRLMPKGLFGRTLLIIVIPTFLALTVATFVFFDRHWYTITNRLSHAVAGEIGFAVETLRKASSQDEKDAIVIALRRKTDIAVSFDPEGSRLLRSKRTLNPIRDILREALAFRLRYPFSVNIQRGPALIVIQVAPPEGVYTFAVPQKRIDTPTTEVFISWMVGSSILLSAIALLFMRNQIRPVRRLADAAEAIGKGQDVPWFKPEGATEVRQASSALFIMRDRLRRAMTQRTTMLAGVSHDLRTPLTRMKLQLAMMPETAITRGFQADIAEMESMLEAYLAFARGEEDEQPVDTDLKKWLESIVEATKRENPNISLAPCTSIEAMIRPNALRRCMTNLISNALRYGNKATVRMEARDNALDIFVDDDGPGIAPEKREDVFKAFFRLDESRNRQKGGVGLGLTVARDIARAHGGDVQMSASPEGGLRAHLWLPL